VQSSAPSLDGEIGYLAGPVSAGQRARFLGDPRQAAALRRLRKNMASQRPAGSGYPARERLQVCRASREGATTNGGTGLYKLASLPNEPTTQCRLLEKGLRIDEINKDLRVRSGLIPRPPRICGQYT